MSEFKSCRWTLLLGCNPEFKQVPTDSMCVACTLGWLDRALKHEDLAVAGEHFVVLTQILTSTGVVFESDFKAAFVQFVTAKPNPLLS